MKIKFFKDILKVKVEDGSLKYSQGRIYLFVFVVAYLAALVYYMFFGKNDSTTTIIDGLQWAILTFAVYVFGGKGVDAAKDVLKMKGIKGFPPQDTPPQSKTPTTTPLVTPAAPDATSPLISSGQQNEEELTS